MVFLLFCKNVSFYCVLNHYKTNTKSNIDKAQAMNSGYYTIELVVATTIDIF